MLSVLVQTIGIQSLLRKKLVKLAIQKHQVCNALFELNNLSEHNFKIAESLKINRCQIRIPLLYRSTVIDYYEESNLSVEDFMQTNRSAIQH